MMLGHYLRIVWNRRKANGLILTEILASFLVLCLVFSVVAYYQANWQKPLGFDYHNVWTLSVGMPNSRLDDKEEGTRNLEVSRQLLGEMHSHPEIVAVSPLANTPYSGSTSRWGIRLPDRKVVNMLSSNALPEGREALKLELIEGRWIEPGDEALDFTPIVISENMAHRVFGRTSPLNQAIPEYSEDGKPDVPTNSWEVKKVVGVIRNFRKGGELSETPYAGFMPQSMTDHERSWAPWNYVVRIQPGTPAAFEETLLRSLQKVAPEWNFNIRSMEAQRANYLKGRLTPLLIGGTLAAFLVLMVGMGLLGVLWQNVSQRTQELGLRRALGATATQVRNQIIGEIVMLTTLALILGSVLFVQVPLLGLMSFVPLGVFLTAMVAAILLIYPFVILCGLYPGWLATRVQPSEALQYE